MAQERRVRDGRIVTGINSRAVIGQRGGHRRSPIVSSGPACGYWRSIRTHQIAIRPGCKARAAIIAANQIVTLGNKSAGNVGTARGANIQSDDTISDLDETTTRV